MKRHLGRTAYSSAIGILAIAVVNGTSRDAIAGTPPPLANNPLPTPLFTIDQASLSIGGPIHADDVLQKPGPSVAIPNVGLGLGMPGDELDGISFNRRAAAAGSFALLFGVDRETVGAVPPDPGLVGLGFPYNVQQQASLNQAAADMFMTTSLFTTTGPVPFAPRVTINNILVVNQGDAGGVDFDLQPAVPPSSFVPPGPSENSDGYTYPTSSLRGPAPADIYFSVSRNSPSLITLPGSSGADVFFDSNPFAPGGEVLYANFNMLGLQPFDDIDDMIILDDGDNVFEPGLDQVLFSLTRDSPSLGALGVSPADVLTSSGFVVHVFAEAGGIGLLPTDNVDALELLQTDDIMSSIIDHAIFPEPTSMTLALLAAGLLAGRRRGTSRR